jgi:hypothetical protein
VQRLLGRFLAQGFVYHDLSRACLAQSDDPIPRVVLLGRLALYRREVRIRSESPSRMVRPVSVVSSWSRAERASVPAAVEH